MASRNRAAALSAYGDNMRTDDGKSPDHKGKEQHMRGKPLKELFIQIIDQRRKKLQEEIQDLEDRRDSDMQALGCGGAYNRKNAAIERREEMLEELEATEKQVKGFVRLKEEFYYKLYCKECTTVIMTKNRPTGDWHECPCCKKTFYENAPQKYSRMVGDEAWLRNY